MFHRVVFTTGISTLAGHNHFGNWMKRENLAVFTEGRFLKAPKDAEITADDGAAILDAWKDARPEPVGDPKKVSAEYSTLHALRQNGRLAAHPKVELIITDTLAGHVASTALKKILAHDFDADVAIHLVDDLKVTDRQEMRRSLGIFMNAVSKILQAGEPQTTCFAPVGGFKVMTALGYLAGAYLHYPSFYLHEDAQILHEIPWVPIHIAPNTLRDLATIIRRAFHGLNTASLGNSDLDALNQHHYLFEHVDDLVFLNAFGLFLRGQEEYRAIIGTKIEVNPDLKSLVAEHGDFVRREIDNLLGKLEDATQNRGELHHEANFKHHDTAFGLYKGSSGDKVFRAAWRFREDVDTLQINNIWLNHDRYEREAEAGKHLNDAPASWLDITEDLENVQ